MIIQKYLSCVVFVHEHLMSKYVDVYETVNGREVTNAEPEAEIVWLEPVNEANVELLVVVAKEAVVVAAKEAVVLEADKILLIVASDEEDADAVYKACVSECPVEEERKINTETRGEVGLTNRLAGCFAGVSIRV